MTKVVHFDIDADEPEKLTEFYKKVFGWEFMKWDGPMDYWIITTGKEDEPGIGGGLSKRGGHMPLCNTIAVSSIDEFIKSISENGGVIYVPKMAIPGIGWIAYFKDPEGNNFGIMEDDPSAK